MQKLRSYISILFLALLLFPMAEKVKHELGHLKQEHCDTTGIHYCEKEHTCHICDYIFSSSAEPPKSVNEFTLFSSVTTVCTPDVLSGITTSPQYTFLLRGPPAC